MQFCIDHRKNVKGRLSTLYMGTDCYCFQNFYLPSCLINISLFIPFSKYCICFAFMFEGITLLSRVVTFESCYVTTYLNIKT